MAIGVLFAACIALDSPKSVPFPFLPFLPLLMILIVIAARRKQMEKAGTWYGFGSIDCENKWNGGKGKNRTRMLAAAGIGEDDPEYAAVLGMTWVEVPAERRRQVYEAIQRGKKRK